MAVIAPLAEWSSDAPREELQVCGLSVEAGGHRVLSDLSLTVRRGEIVGLLGRDGAGKTSCFEAMAGLVPVLGGQVRLNGVDITDWSVDRRARLGLAYLPEEPSVFRGLTVEENIAAVLEGREMSTVDRSAALEQLLTDFDLAQIRSQVASTISGGERRRCEVARAMALKPLVLLLDEPFRGLDPTSIDSVKQLMVQLKSCAVGVLASDYDLHDLLILTDRVYLLHGGRVAFSGTATQLLADAHAHRIFLGEGFSL